MIYIQLRAYSPEQNIDRYYSIRVGQNLFKHWTVAVQYTRFRTRGEGKIFAYDTIEEAQEKVRRIIKRRVYTKNRENTYKLIGIQCVPNIDIRLWVPAEETPINVPITPLANQPSLF